MGRSRNKLKPIAPVLAGVALGLALAACGGPRSDRTAASDLAAAQPSSPAASATLASVKARRRLRCGVSQDKPGFATRGLGGQWRGFDVDLCRAVAAAVLGDSRAVSFTPLTNRTRFAAVQSGAVDMASGGGAWTFTHDAVLGLTFAGVSYYDGQGFLVRRSSAFRTIADLGGARICVLGGAPEQQALADAFKARGQTYQAVAKDTLAEAAQAYRQNACDALSDDLSALAGVRAQMRRPDDHVVLPGSIADEPLGLIVREDDPRWADIVRWTLNAVILAEELQVASGAADGLRRSSSNPAIQRLLGTDGEFGRRLGLSDDWSYRAIRQVGGYGEIFARNLGPLGLERGRNALWDAEEPGQLYAPPLR